MWGITPLIPASVKVINRKIMVQASPGEKHDLFRKKTAGVTQVAQYLPSKCKSLSSNTSITKTNKQTKNTGSITHPHKNKTKQTFRL
jgi:hypothetical protein